MMGRMGTDTAPAAEPFTLDWSTLPELHCPLCEYNLRGLTEPRCPECGYVFTWAELLDSNRLKHSYLFEHHPKHNVWSFVRTLTGGLRPRRFWRTLNPAMPSRPGRLALYAVLVTFLLVMTPSQLVSAHHA
jgi:hypothetical protein